MVAQVAQMEASRQAHLLQECQNRK